MWQLLIIDYCCIAALQGKAVAKIIQGTTEKIN